MTAAVLDRSRNSRAQQPRRAGGGSSSSARAATARADAPRTDRRAAARRPKLKVLDQRAARQRARRRNALLLLFIVVLIGFFGVAFVHAELVAGQQDLDAVRAEIAEAEARKANLSRVAEEASSPQAIVAKAEDLGMVRAYQPVYLQATAPLRDMAEVVPPPSPVASNTLQLATSVPGLSAGISAEAPVISPAADADVAVDTDVAAIAVPGSATSAVATTTPPATTPPANPEPAGAVAGSTAPVESPATAVEASTLGGVSVASPADPTAASGTGQGEVSIAGSRAVTTGSVGAGAGSG